MRREKFSPSALCQPGWLFLSPSLSMAQLEVDSRCKGGRQVTKKVNFHVAIQVPPILGIDQLPSTVGKVELHCAEVLDRSGQSYLHFYSTNSTLEKRYSRHHVFSVTFL
jgi:hypothetical protein